MSEAAPAPRWADLDLPPGTASGVGSWPGVDPDEAARTVMGELPDLPHLPELPDRGVGADLVGRTAALLEGLGVDLQPAGWRLLGVGGRAGRDARRARGALSRDLDALEEVAVERAGPLKLQLCGPLTLAAALELPRGGPALGDPGAVRDVTGALAEAVAAHVADVQRRLPAARLLLQVDEPSLPAVVAGAVPTASGFGRLRAVPAPDARDLLAEPLDAARRAGALPVVHCCASRPPVRLAAAAGASAVSFDATLLSERDDEDLGTAVEAGVGLLLGLVPTPAQEEAAPPRERDARPRPRAAVLADPARLLWRRLGFLPGELAGAVVVTPTCGLAGASPAAARAVLARAREVARVLAEAPDGTGDGPAGDERSPG